MPALPDSLYSHSRGTGNDPRVVGRRARCASDTGRSLHSAVMTAHDLIYVENTIGGRVLPSGYTKSLRGLAPRAVAVGVILLTVKSPS